MVDFEDRWSQVIAAASNPPGSGRHRHEALQNALGLGTSITQDSVGCSVTETAPHGFRTPAASSDVAMALDLAQYRADDGPCVAACRDGRVHSIVVMADEAAYTGFTAAALAHDVRSSLSLPLTGTSRPSALNLYAASTSAFESKHARSVAGLLSRCVAALLPEPHWADGLTGVIAGGRTAADTAHDYVTRATQVVQKQYGMDPARAYHHLTRLSRREQRSVIAIAGDILAGAGLGADGG
jgi:hypothetical protein